MPKRVIKILHVEKKKNQKTGDTYYKTHLMTEDGEESQYYGNDLIIGNFVNTFYDARWNVIKAERPNAKGIDK